MRSYSLSTLAVFLIGIFAILPSAFAEDDTPDQQDAEFILPNWVKLVAGYWYDDKVKDQQFFGTIGYLIANEIIILPTDAEPSTSNYIPVWVKNIAGWWASDQIDDQTFVNGLQYLVQIGSIQVQEDKHFGGGGGGGGGGGY